MKLIGNGRLVTRDKDQTFYENGAVAVEGNLIVETGPYERLKEKYKDAKFIDAEGMFIMPGFINAHEHIYSAFARGLNLPGPVAKDFLEVLDGTWWNIDRHMTLENVYYSAIATYLECIANGVTTVVDHHASYGAIDGSLFAITKAAEELNIRTCLAYEISDRDGKAKRNQAITENMEFLQYVKDLDSTMLKGMIGLHASFTLSDETLRIIQKENKFDAGYHVHIAEGLYDEQHAQKNYLSSIVSRFYDHGILGKKTIAGHCIHVSEEDIKLLKETKTNVVHNPESNMGNGVGCPDCISMLDQGIVVGLGTDGYTNDMLESLKVANILQKHRRKMPDRGFCEACSMLFEHNRTIASNMFETTLGVLEAGAAADLIIVDYRPYSTVTKDNINGHIMFGMNGAMTDTTIIDGELRMRHRRFIGIDEETRKKQCMQSADELWKRLCEK